MFAIIVAGKNATTQARKLHQFLSLDVEGLSPFEFVANIERLGLLDLCIRSCGLGQYTRIAKAFREVCIYKAEKMEFSDLISIHGISSKTANFFLLHSRKGYIGAALDVHILKFIRANGYPDAPKQTPPPSKYQKWQAIFLDLCAKMFPEKSIADVDLEIWKSYKKA